MSAADPLAGLVASLPEADGPAMSAILRLLDGAPGSRLLWSGSSTCGTSPDAPWSHG
jgi:hypothetical protein